MYWKMSSKPTLLSSCWYSRSRSDSQSARTAGAARTDANKGATGAACSLTWNNKKDQNFDLLISQKFAILALLAQQTRRISNE